MIDNAIEDKNRRTTKSWDTYSNDESRSNIVQHSVWSWFGHELAEISFGWIDEANKALEAKLRNLRGES